MLKKIIVSPLLQILLLTAFVFAAMLSALMPLENANFDLWSSHFRRPVDQPIAIVAIDEKSVARIGDWPWSRDRIAEMARLLSTHQAAAQGICLLFAHPDLNPGLDVLESLREQISAEKWPGDQRTLKRLEGMLDHAKDGLDHDGRLIQAVRQAKNVVLPLYFRPGTPNATDAEDLTGVLIIHSMNAQSLPVVGTKRPWLVDIVSGDQRHLPMAAGKVRVTFDDLATKAGALGHLNLDEDSDGTLRRVPLLVDYKGRLFASLALQLTLKHLNTNLRALAIDLDFLSQPTLRIKHVRIDTDEAFHMLIGFDRQWTREHTYSFVDLIDGSIDPAIVKNKIVLIGPTADTIGQHYRVGAAGRASNVEIQANILARALSTARLSRPSWARLLEITALFYFAFFLIFVIPRVQFKVGLAILVVFAATWYVMTVGLMP
ncbi:MAG: CHASE2 domain-containing protein, partial [Desulfatitalea sp.]|nr:CHASE2 domain-containing protein [Desulfatitalea sp.]NNJ99022.1 CHASE2 domain-containing protein [Desulfatitalea sp.]